MKVFKVTVITLACSILLTAAAQSKTTSDYIPDLTGSDLQKQALAAKQILNHPKEVPIIALERAILIAGDQHLQETKQSLIDILGDVKTFRGTTRALAANSLGYIAQRSQSGIDRNDIYKALMAATYDRFWEVRMAACRALGNEGNKDAAMRLNEIFFTDSDPRVQLYASKAYLELTGMAPGQQSSSVAAPMMATQNAAQPSSTTTESVYQSILNYISNYFQVK